MWLLIDLANSATRRRKEKEPLTTDRVGTSGAGVENRREQFAGPMEVSDLTRL